MHRSDSICLDLLLLAGDGSCDELRFVLLFRYCDGLIIGCGLRISLLIGECYRLVVGFGDSVGLRRRACRLLHRGAAVVVPSESS